MMRISAAYSSPMAIQKLPVGLRAFSTQARIHRVVHS